MFESGTLTPDGRVMGDDHDADGSRYEPHHTTIDSPDQVQIYQAVMVDGDGAVTTGLMSAERWVKDNRILPDRLRSGQCRRPRAPRRRCGLRCGLHGGQRPRAVLRRRWIRRPVPSPWRPSSGSSRSGIRWAENLAAYDAPETRRFVGYYREMAGSSALLLARASGTN